MLAKETNEKEQPDDIDTYIMPPPLFMRVYHDDKAAKLLGKETCEIWNLFGLMKDTVAPQNGYQLAEIEGVHEMECYYKRNDSEGRGFACVPIKG